MTHQWGRTPVTATVEGHTWKTSVWREKSGRVLLAVPKKVRGAKGHGDRVAVRVARPLRKPNTTFAMFEQRDESTKRMEAP
mgnify:CR=1 FL=1